MATPSLLSCENAVAFISESRTVGYAIADADFKFVYANRAYCDFLQAPPELVIGTTCAYWTHPDDVKDEVAAAESLVRGEAFSYTYAKRYVPRGSTPSRKLEIWGVLEVQSIWEGSKFVGFRKKFTPWEKKLQNSLDFRDRLKVLKGALTWLRVNWQTTLIIIATALSMTSIGSTKLFELLRQAQEAKRSVDGLLEPLPSSSSQPLE